MQKLKVIVSGTGPALVLLHGWAMNSSVWQVLKPQLESIFTIYYIDLPGHGINVECGVNADLDGWLEALCAAVPVNAIWLGWSLGGELALALAARYPQRVDRLIMVASSPKFVDGEDWGDGLSADLFATFESGISAHSKHTLEHFIRLQSLGGVRRKEVYLQLEAVFQESSMPAWKSLETGLVLLKNLDLRRDFRNLSVPILVFLGQHDRLVPVEVGNMMQLLNPAIDLEIMVDSGHVPFLSQPQMFVSRITNWI